MAFVHDLTSAYDRKIFSRVEIGGETITGLEVSEDDQATIMGIDEAEPTITHRRQKTKFLQDADDEGPSEPIPKVGLAATKLCRLAFELANETTAFIEQRRSGEPFFAFLSFYAVHAPIQTTEDLWKKYRDKAVTQSEDGARFIFDRRYAVRQKQDHPVFAGLVETMDTAVGIVLDALKRTGLDENTIVVFTSDNGGLSSGDGHGTSVLPLRGGKGRQFEGGIRVPYYVYVPGATNSGADIDVPVSGVDFYPTLLELTGLKIPGNHRVDGQSLVPLLRGGRIADRALYWHYPHYGNQGGEPSSMIIENQWKLILYHEDERVELYDVVEDVGEENDVSDLQTEEAAAMKTKLDQWLASTNAKLPTANPDFDEDQRAKRWEDLRTDALDRLDEIHDSYLDPEYDPGNAWWGSEVH